MCHLNTWILTKENSKRERIINNFKYVCYWSMFVIQLLLWSDFVAARTGKFDKINNIEQFWTATAVATEKKHLTKWYYLKIIFLLQDFGLKKKNYFSLEEVYSLHLHSTRNKGHLWEGKASENCMRVFVVLGII